MSISKGGAGFLYPSREWSSRIRKFDSSVISVHSDSLDSTQASSGPDEQGILVAAMASAARAAWRATRGGGDLAYRKRQVDGSATTAAESILSMFEGPLRVVAGEGRGDQMPGAFAGQRLGREAPDETGLPWNGIFDYVDGTTLGALGLPGALALGGLGQGLASVPDLQAYAILVPSMIVSETDISSAPEDHATTVLDAIMRVCGPAARAELRVVTHSDDTGPFHHTLIRELRNAGVGEVIIPEPVIVETPYVLARAGVVAPRIDTIIGTFGFPELMFSMLLLDLLCPEFTFVFRPASLSATRKNAQVLAPLFTFDDAELAELNHFGWAPTKQYQGSQLVPAGAARCAAIFAVTDNPALHLIGPRAEQQTIAVEGLLIRRGRVTRLRVFSNTSDS